MKLFEHPDFAQAISMANIVGHTINIFTPKIDRSFSKRYGKIFT
jgi:hypothetical protein